MLSISLSHSLSLHDITRAPSHATYFSGRSLTPAAPAAARASFVIGTASPHFRAWASRAHVNTFARIMCGARAQSVGLDCPVFGPRAIVVSTIWRRVGRGRLDAFLGKLNSESRRSLRRAT